MKLSTTGSGDFPNHLTILLAGSPKSGKTSLVGGIPNCIVADTEPGANNLASIAHKNVPYTTINSSDDLRSLLLVLQDPKQRAKAAQDLGIPQIEAVAIDTIDSLQEILKTERLKEQRQTTMRRDDWSWLLETMTSIVQAFCALPMHVVFVVHTKTQDLGTDDDPHTVVVPSLSGQMANRIAGMVGYSLGTFRRVDIMPDGTPKTTYWLRTEGDETFTTLGNRAAGRLPEIMEPDFGKLLAAATGGRPRIESVEKAKPEKDPEPAPDPVPDPDPVNPNAITADALNHLHGVWKAIGQDIDEADLRERMTIDQAREVFAMWQAFQADWTNGVTKVDPVEGMTSYLRTVGWLPGDPQDTQDEKPDEQPEQPEEAPEEAIVSPAEPGDSPTAEHESSEDSETNGRPNLQPVETPSEPENGPDLAPEDAQAVTQAVQAVEAQLGAQVVDVITDDGEQAPCDECAKPIDDKDIAVLSQSRTGRWLCVDCYIAAKSK